MNIDQNVSLLDSTTFEVEVQARYCVTIENIDDIQELCEHPLWQKFPHLILGKGSNILFTKDYPGMVIINDLQGKEIVEENNKTAIVKMAAGENWHDFVMWACTNGFWGIENLALIPGSVGASAVQNIGAYGVEAKEVIHSVEVINLKNGTKHIFNTDDCKFSYRNSIFKSHPEYYITAVTFRLSKIPQPILTYGSLQKILEEKQQKTLTPQVIAESVMDIRQRKLPALGEIGMAGSFFKNPVITKQHYQALQEKYPEIPSFVVDEARVKVPAGWILETLGYKGIKKGRVGTYKKHALVLVNYGGATGAEVWDFAQSIMNEVHEKMNIRLEPEVIII